MAYILPFSLSLLLLFVFYKFFNFLYSSIRIKIPNAHPTSPISSLWINWIRYNRNENKTIHAAFRKHGPIVRLAPGEIAVNCVDGGIQKVYAGGFGFEKHEWYSNLFDNYGVPNMFSTTPNHAHSVRKRMLSHIYSKSYIQKSPAMRKITQRILFERLLPCLTCMANEVDVKTTGEDKQRYLQQSSQPVDVLNLFSAITMDFVSAYQFGMANGTNMSGQEQGSTSFNVSPARISSEEFFELYRSRHVHTFWPQEHPRLTRFLRFIGIRLVPRFVDEANAKIEDMLMRMCDAAAATSTINVGNKEDLLTEKKEYERIEDTPVVYAQLSESLARNETLENQKRTEDVEDERFQYRRQRIASELLDHFAAGFETSGITLAYAAYELCRHQDIQAELRDELRSLGNSTESPLTSYLTSYPSTINSSSSLHFSSSPSPEVPPIPDAKLIDELPLLHAILLETLRLHSAIPGPQPRVTPSPSRFISFNSQGSAKSISAAATTKSATLAGYDSIPPGVRVSAQAYSLHRNADVFPEPDSWVPHRWLTDPVVDDQGRKRYRLRGSKGKSNNDGRGDNNNDTSNEEDTAIKEMYRWFWAFGSGGRMCVGSNLAMYQMKYILTALYANFSTLIVDDDDDNNDGHDDNHTGVGIGVGIEQRDSYTAPPKSEQLLLRLKKART